MSWHINFVSMVKYESNLNVIFHLLSSQRPYIKVIDEYEINSVKIKIVKVFAIIIQLLLNYTHKRRVLH